jgi:hypothetical protein
MPERRADEISQRGEDIIRRDVGTWLRRAGFFVIADAAASGTGP